MLLWHVTFSLVVSASSESLLSQGISSQEGGSGLVFAHNGVELLEPPKMGSRVEGDSPVGL